MRSSRYSASAVNITKKDVNEMDKDEYCVNKYGTYYACYKQYRKILTWARQKYMRENYTCAPRDFVIPTDEIKLTTFIDEDLCRYITALTMSIHKLEGDDLYKESMGSLIDLKKKLLEVWDCEGNYQ